MTIQTDAGKNLDIMALMIAFAFKWDKTEYKDRISLWMEDFVKSMSKEEKNEFLVKVKELGLVEKIG